MVNLMITIDDLYILNDDEYNKEVNKFLIEEVDKQNKFIMSLDVDINENTFYKMFCKKNKSGNEEDH